MWWIKICVGLIGVNLCDGYDQVCDTAVGAVLYFYDYNVWIAYLPFETNNKALLYCRVIRRQLIL